MRRSQVLSLILFIYLVVSPLLAGYIVSSASGIVRDVEYTYTDSTVLYCQTYVKNSSNIRGATAQTYTFDNDTLTLMDPGMTFESVDSYNYVEFYVIYNITSVLDSNVYKITFSYSYSGVGNVTGVQFYYGDAFNTYVTDLGVNHRGVSWVSGAGNQLYASTTDVAENDTISFELEAFQGLRFGSANYTMLKLIFDDSANVPVAGDYVEVLVHYYKKDTIVSRSNLITYVIGFLTFVNVLLVVGISKFWNPFRK